MLMAMEVQNTIVTLIGSVGFPIVMSLILVKLMKESNDQHKAEMDKMSQAVENNTLTMQRLLDRLEREEKE